MAIQRAAPRTSTIEVLDRILDKGIVIDARVEVSLVGLHLVDIDARVIVSSIETYVKHAADVAEVHRRPRLIGAPCRPRTIRAPARRGGVPSVRHPRQRTQPLVAYRCPSGCAFSRPPLAHTETAACPYRPDATCVLQRV